MKHAQNIIQIIFLFFALIILTILGGCASSGFEVMEATSMCAARDGIMHLYAWPTHEVMCNDGAFIEL